MQDKTVTIPELALIAGTRVALGAGLALVIGEKLGRDARKGAGWALLAVGALSTIPILMGVFGKAPVTATKVA